MPHEPDTTADEDTRIRDLEPLPAVTLADFIAADRLGIDDAGRVTVGDVLDLVPDPPPGGDMDTTVYDPEGKAAQLATEAELLALAGAIPDVLDDLADVDTDGQTSGQVLTTDGENWTPQTLPPGGGDPIGLDDLTDVATAGQSAGQVLTTDGENWTPADLPPGGGSGDMETAVYDPEGKAAQLATEAELAAVASMIPVGIDDLEDVDAESPGEGRRFQFNAGTWSAVAPSTGKWAVLRRWLDTQANVNTTAILDLENFASFDLTLIGPTELNFANITGDGYVEFVVILRGGQEVTYNDVVLWPGNQVPPLAGPVDVVAFWTVDNVTFHGTTIGEGWSD